MSIAIGIDFGSRHYRAAFVLGDQIVTVPMQVKETAWTGRIVVESDPDRPPLGINFSSLKHHLGSGTRFDWEGVGVLTDDAMTLPEDALRNVVINIKRIVETY